MPFQKGHPRFGGKQKGTPNRKKRQSEQQYQQAVLAAVLTPEQLEELTPMLVMRHVMRHRFRAGDMNGALAAASQLAPYVHARLTAVDMKVEQNFIKLNDEDLALEIETLRAKIAEARANALSSPTIDGQIACQ